MKAVIEKKTAGNDQKRSNVFDHDSVKRLVFFSPSIEHTNSTIQRKPLCPCGGGCPRCSGVIQAKLKVGQPNDICEQEADRVADQVMRMPAPTVQGKPG